MPLFNCSSNALNQWRSKPIIEVCIELNELPTEAYEFPLVLLVLGVGANERLPFLRARMAGSRELVGMQGL
jgi:hypothetical protein